MPQFKVEVIVEAEDADMAHYQMEPAIRNVEGIEYVSTGDTTRVED